MHGMASVLHNLFPTSITCKVLLGLNMLAKHIQTVVYFGCIAYWSFCSMSLALHAMHTCSLALPAMHTCSLALHAKHTLEQAWLLTSRIDLNRSVHGTLLATTLLVQC